MFLTIFTPVYNRDKYMPRLFKSIEKQKYKDFEWIIINDGSTDNTEKTIQNLIKENKYNFPVRYFKVKNGGKHRAINKAVKVAKGKYFLIVDSDDWLLPNATDLIKKWTETIEKLPNANEFAGVSGLIETPSGKILSGTGNGKKYVDASNLKRYKYNLEGDMSEVYKTSILKKYPFKEFKMENFLTERTVWNKIAADGYIIRWYMKPIYVGDYLQDGLTKNAFSRDMNNFNGLTYATKMDLKLMLSFKQKMHFLNYYIMIGRKKKYSWRKIANMISLPLCPIFIQYYLYMTIRKILKKPLL